MQVKAVILVIQSTQSINTQTTMKQLLNPTDINSIDQSLYSPQLTI